MWDSESFSTVSFSTVSWDFGQVASEEVCGGDDAPDWADKKVADLRKRMIRDDELTLEIIMSAVTRGMLH